MLLHLDDEFYAVDVHVLIRVFLDQWHLSWLASTLCILSGISISGCPTNSAAPSRKGRKW